jgi:hypothetical protein
MRILAQDAAAREKPVIRIIIYHRGGTAEDKTAHIIRLIMCARSLDSTKVDII